MLRGMSMEPPPDPRSARSLVRRACRRRPPRRVAVCRPSFGCGLEPQLSPGPRRREERRQDGRRVLARPCGRASALDFAESHRVEVCNPRLQGQRICSLRGNAAAGLALHRLSDGGAAVQGLRDRGRLWPTLHAASYRAPFFRAIHTVTSWPASSAATCRATPGGGGGGGGYQTSRRPPRWDDTFLCFVETRL